LLIIKTNHQKVEVSKKFKENEIISKRIKENRRKSAHNEISVKSHVNNIEIILKCIEIKLKSYRKHNEISSKSLREITSKSQRGHIGAQIEIATAGTQTTTGNGVATALTVESK
jgi:hypothetical protein